MLNALIGLGVIEREKVLYVGATRVSVPVPPFDDLMGHQAGDRLFKPAGESIPRRLPAT